MEVDEADWGGYDAVDGGTTASLAVLLDRCSRDTAEIHRRYSRDAAEIYS